MDEKVDKRQRAMLFRDRLGRAMETASVSRSALARLTGVTRSTVSQLLDDAADRLPNAHLAADCAAALGVSADWLLGLTERPERPGDIVAASVEMAEAARAVSDDQMLQWHEEATGYKVRHVPATLPDMLKIKPVLEWEYAAFLGKTPDQAIGAMEDRIAWLRSSNSDYEIAVPLHELDSLAAGEGYYSGLDRTVRRDQIEWLAEQCETLYPALRLFLFDARRVFSAPITVFGPRIGVLYVGSVYIAFRESSRIRSLTRHFDQLVREAQVDARDVATYLTDLAGRVR